MVKKTKENNVGKTYALWHAMPGVLKPIKNRLVFWPSYWSFGARVAGNLVVRALDL